MNSLLIYELFRLEEVEFDENDNVWLVTLSYQQQRTESGILT